MDKRDYYEVLGVERADSAELKKVLSSYRDEEPPDRNPGDEEAEQRFKEANEAYEVLSDKEKRAAYDQFGHAGPGGMGGGAGANASGFSDIFGDICDIFGGSRGRSHVQRGADLSYTLSLSLEDAVRGTEVKIRIPTTSTCGTCDGSGAKKGTSPENCATCGGMGNVRMRQGPFSVQQTCPRCQGAGKTIKDPCHVCHGRGNVEETKTLSVKVPAGVDDGDRIRLTGEGEAGVHGGPPGDLYVQMAVKEHPIFQRDGSNLYCEIPITFVDAALGGELEVPTLEGKVKLKNSYPRPRPENCSVCVIRGSLRSAVALPAISCAG